jgi:hypothetical protein
MTIISGTAEFTTPRPFESRSARVALNFTVPDGADVDRVIAKVGSMARIHAHMMISDKVDPEATIAQHDGPFIVLGSQQEAALKTGDVIPPTPAAAPRTRTRAAAAPPPAPVVPAADVSAGGDLIPGEVIPPTPPAPLPPPAPPGSTATPTSDPLAPPAAPTSAAGLPVNLSDAALNNAITAKLSSHEAGTPQRQALTGKIKELRAEYTGGLEIPWAAVQDADKRTLFLGRLGML